jgi:membrane-associated phospholipid phosphatase
MTIKQRIGIETNTEMNIIFRISILFLIIQLSFPAIAQDTTKVYKVHHKIEIPATLGLFASHYLWGFDWVRGKDTYSEAQVNALNVNDIWKFDRWAAEQDASYRETAHTISDWGLNTMLVAPALLALDKNIRKDWFDLLVLYGETHAINTSMYIMTSGLVNRARPLMYNDGVPMGDRTGKNTLNSFFSGHVSTTASSSFFMAKVYCDYHPELGNKKYWLYAAAVIPPAFVGFYRIRALKHFPTDVITGTIVGAASGILVPHLHKKKKKKYGFSFVPYVGEVNGIYIKYAFK